jgi:uncharacterized membrane protein SirB2
MYALLKILHLCMAVLTISGFIVRGAWMLSGSVNLDRKLVRILPHIIDTVFLLSGIGLIVLLQLPIIGSPWLIAKLTALIVYIMLGTIALRRGKTMRVKAIAFILALLTFTYIVGVALSKSVWSWMALA